MWKVVQSGQTLLFGTKKSKTAHIVMMTVPNDVGLNRAEKENKSNYQDKIK